MELTTIVEMEQHNYSTSYIFSTVEETDAYRIVKVRDEEKMLMYAIYYQIGEYFYYTRASVSKMKGGRPTLHARELTLLNDEQTGKANMNYDWIHFEKISNEQQPSIIEIMDGFIHFIIHLPVYRIKSIVEGWKWQWNGGYETIDWKELKENSIQGGTYGTKKNS